MICYRAYTQPVQCFYVMLAVIRISNIGCVLGYMPITLTLHPTEKEFHNRKKEKKRTIVALEDPVCNDLDR